VSPEQPSRLVVPLLVAAAWGAVGVSLLLVRPETVGVDLLHLYPWIASVWLPPIPTGILLLVGACGLVSYRRQGWWAALCLALVGAFLHPYQFLASLLLVPYLLCHDVRAAFGIARRGPGCRRCASVLGAMVVLVLCVLSAFHAVLLPNVTGALDRGKQKRAMGDLRTIATAVESYSIDHGPYPRHVGNVEGLARFVEPTYIRVLPTRDGWGTPLWYVSTLAAPKAYRIQAFGSDCVESGPRSGMTTRWTDDVIFETGSFLAYPGGTQR